MKNKRFKNAKMKMQNFFIKLKHRDTSFFIIALCVVILATAIVWRYSSTPGPDKGNNLAGKDAENENIGVNLDPYQDYVEGIIKDYENANNDKDKDKDTPNNKIDLNSMKTPLAGEIYREFTMDDLIYYEAIGEWRVHKGVDIKPKDTLLIESALAGTVMSVNTSELSGTEVIIDHGDNIKTVYSNLASAAVKTGEHVKQGQAIGNIGKTVGIEASDGAHLHFELLVDGKNVNPMDYIN